MKTDKICVLMSLPVEAGITQAYFEIDDPKVLEPVCWELLQNADKREKKCDFVLLTVLGYPEIRTVRRMLPASQKIVDLFQLWTVPWDSVDDRKLRKIHVDGAKQGVTYTMHMDASRIPALIPVEPD